MKLQMLAFSLVLAGLSFGAQTSQASGFDPVGKWRVATVNDDGTPMNVSVDIAGKPGAYTGQAVAGERTLDLTDLATTPTGMIAVFAHPQGSIVVKIASGQGARFVGAWGMVEQSYALTAERVK